ncbi:DMT family transporter [Frateuria aurantia]
MPARSIVCAILSALLFGFGAPAAHRLLADASPQMLAGLLYLGSGLGLALWRMIQPGHGREAPLSRQELPALLSMIVFGGLLGAWLLMEGLQRTDAASGSLLLNLESVTTLLIAWLVMREAVDRRLLLGALAIVAGSVCLNWHGHAQASQGNWLIAAACLCWGIDNNVTSRLSHRDPVRLAMLKGLVAGPWNLLLAELNGHHLPSPGVALTAMALGVVAYGLSLVLYILANRGLGAARSAAYFALAPFAGAGLAILAFHQPLTEVMIVAAALMAVGVLLHLLEEHKHEHEHEAMEHEHRHRHDAHHQHVHGPDDPPGEWHSHPHRHAPLKHSHAHYPDLHHRHRH